jgi:outer membrane protein OmpA-like peptidoglycan-associated protein
MEAKMLLRNKRVLWAVVTFVYVVGAMLISPGLLVAAENFGSRTPTEEDLLEALDPPLSRGLKAGAAAKSMAAPSVSMQIRFGLNSVKISDDSAEALSNLAKAMQSDRLKDKSFKVIGHTDASGSDAYNIELSNRRAKAVRDYLVRLGLEGGRLEALGKGKAELLDKDNPLSADNRRVEFSVATK